MIRLNILNKVKKVVLQIALIIILETSELIQMVLYLLLKKKLTFHNVIILIKSVVNKDKNNCYFLEKGSCKDKSNT